MTFCSSLPVGLTVTGLESSPRATLYEKLDYILSPSLLCTYNEQVASKPTPLTSEGDIPVVDSTDLTQVQIDFHIYTNQSFVILLLILSSVCLDTSSEDCS